MEEHFFPGLLKAMEERLGPFGRPLTTLLILAVVLGIFVFVGDLVYTKAVAPIVQAFGEPPENLVREVLTRVVVYGVLMAASAALMVFITRRIIRRAMRVKADLEKHVEDHLSENNAEHHLMALDKAHRADLKAIKKELQRFGISLEGTTVRRTDKGESL